MNIAFDATAILGPMSKGRGIGNYALSQFKTMLGMDSTHQYFCFNCFDGRIFGDDTDAYKNLQECTFYGGKDRFLFTKKEYAGLFKELIQRFIRHHQIDVFYVTSPFDEHTLPYQRAWFGPINVVATVYDIIPYVMKDLYLKDKITREWYMRHVACVKEYDRFLVISRSVKQDLIKHFAIDGEKIEVIHGAAGSLYKKITVLPEEKRVLYDKYRIHDPFILCTAGDDRRKNIDGIINAYARMPQALIDIYQLVIVCKLSPPSRQVYSELITDRRLNGRVVLTGYVADPDLLRLYNLAALAAFPSKYEGFGLPVVEAFACGVPVLTSNNSSLGEVAEGAAVLVDPFNIEDITKGLVTALTMEDKTQNIRNGYEKIAFYTWDNVAAAAINVIDALPKPKTEPASVRRKIACFTPLPPLESGIADYAVDILNEMSQYVDIDVFTDDGYKPDDASLKAAIRVFNHRAFKNEGYADIVYQVGNSEFHTYMFPYIKKHAGTVVLHDYNLHGVAYASAVVTKKDFSLYGAYLAEDLPVQEAKQYLDDLQNNRISLNIYDPALNGYVTNYAKKIIVHSNESKEKLLKKDIGRNVRVIRHYAKIEPLSDAAHAKEQFGYTKDALIIASYGHVHETKRAMPVLRAFHRLSETYPQVFYVFAGKLAANLKTRFTEYVDKHRLNDRVTVTGYIDLAVFTDYINAADICVNLRYPYNGETSGSLMRILAKGKCVMVNDIGSFGEIPDDCCVKLPHAGNLSESAEVDAIYEALESLVVDTERRNALSRAARQYAETHLDVALIAKQYHDFITDNRSHGLDEDILQRIKAHIGPACYTDGEVRLLSETLAYTLR